MSRAAIYLQKKFNEKAEGKTSHSCELCDERVENLCKLPLFITNRRYSKTEYMVQRCLDCMKIRVNCPNNHPPPAPAPHQDQIDFLTAFTQACLPHIYPPPEPAVQQQEETHSNSLTADTPQIQDSVDSGFNAPSSQ